MTEEIGDERKAARIWSNCPRHSLSTSRARLMHGAHAARRVALVATGSKRGPASLVLVTTGPELARARSGARARSNTQSAATRTPRESRVRAGQSRLPIACRCRHPAAVPARPASTMVRPPRPPPRRGSAPAPERKRESESAQATRKRGRREDGRSKNESETEPKA